MKHLPRTQETVNRNLRDRVRNLERGTQFNPRPGADDEMLVSWQGEVPEQTSGPYRFRYGGQLVVVVFDSDSAGTTDTVFDVLINGAVIDTCTVDDAATAASFYLGNVRVPAGARGQVEVTSGGGHGSGSIVLRMKG